MKLKFNTRMTPLNVLITVGITALVGFMVVQGLLSSIIKNSVKNLSSVAEEGNVMISLSLNTIQSDRPVKQLLVENADYYAAELSSNYSFNVAIFDTSMNVIGTSSTTEDYSIYSKDASQVLRLGQKGYIYTNIDGQNAILFFSPLIVNDLYLGVLMFIYPTTSSEAIISITIRLFVIASIFAAAASALLHSVSQRAVTKPLRQLADYFEKKSVDSNVEFPDIDYGKDDSVGVFVDAYNKMQESINEKMEEVEYQRFNFENIVASLQDAIITFSSDGEVQSYNKKAEEFFSCLSDYNELVPGYKILIKEALMNGDRLKTEASYNGHDFMVVAVPVQRRNEPNSVMFAVSDITAVKQAENEQNRFISSVSHELRTPLTVIIGYTDMLKRRGWNDSNLTSRALDTMEAEAQRLLGLVNDLLSIGRMNSFEFDLFMEDIDLNNVLEEVTNQMNMVGQPRNIMVLYESTPLPLINADKDRLKQCFINVVDNAIKYSNDGDVVRLTAIAYEKYIEVTIRDYGVGIPQEKQQKVFDAFYRVEEDRSRLTPTGGYGLGLSVVKNIIMRHNGSVSIESEKEHGTLVTIRLPIQKEERTNEEG